MIAAARGWPMLGSEKGRTAAMARIELPVPRTFDLTTYLYAAYPRCILDASGFEQWAAARYLRLFSWEGSTGDDPDGQFDLALDYADSFAYRPEGLLEEILVDHSEADSIDNFSKSLEGWLTDGYYVTAFLDVARLRDARSEVCLLHEILIYGVDPERDTVLALAFDNSRGLPIFGRLTLPASTVAAAYESGVRDVVDQTDPWPTYVCQLLRPNRAHPMYSGPFDPDAAVREIQRHFDRVPVDFSDHYFWWDTSGFPPDVDFAYGADALKPAADHLHHVADQRRSLDFRVAHILDEHHSGLVRALDRIASFRGSHLSADVQSNLRAVGLRASRLRMSCLGAWLGHKPVQPGLSGEVVALGRWQEEAVRSALAELAG